MYYVIKKQPDQPLRSFIGFKVPKYIASKNSSNVIFEFIIDGKPQRKWVKKEEIILLTGDKKYFLKVLAQLQETQAQQEKLLEEAKLQLDKCLENFAETMNGEIKEFENMRDSDDDVPCMLKFL